MIEYLKFSSIFGIAALTSCCWSIQSFSSPMLVPEHKMYRRQASNLNCGSARFQCKNGQCIDKAWICDGYKNCIDGSDETFELCKDRSCTSNKFHCKSGQCMDKSWLCDGYENCVDGSDETFELCKDNSCSSTKFHCKNGQCIERAWLCDGYKNCLDGSDETLELCKDHSCSSTKFHCKSGQCMNKAWLCDGYKNCLDGSDETLELCKDYSCTSTKFHCKSGQCMNKAWLCDGYKNCVDGSDETFELCKNNSCNSNKFHCKSGQCIEKAWLCDGYKNCLDGSDETLEQCKQYSSVSSAPDPDQCILPPATPDKTYSISCSTKDKICGTKAGERVPEFTSIISQCNPGYAQYQYGRSGDTRFVSTCLKSSWVPEVVRCKNEENKQTSNSSEVSNAEEMSDAKSCLLPPPPTLDKSFTIKCPEGKIDCVAKDGAKVKEFTAINFRCAKGYTRREGIEFSSICFNGSFLPAIVKCRKICAALPRGLVFTCSESRMGTPQACPATLIEGNVAYPRCQAHYHPDRDLDHTDRYVVCRSDGTWDREFFKCSADCGRTNSSTINLIAHGQREKPGEAPWNVAVYSAVNAKHPTFICGGTLISAQLVLSAAHCFHDSNLQNVSDERLFSVAFGQYSTNFQSNGYNSVKKYKVKKIYVPDEYIGSQTNFVADIAILRLSDKISLSEQILPACVYWSDFTPFKPSGVSVGKLSGFGSTENGTLSPQLLTANLAYISYRNCLKKLEWDLKDSIAHDKFCAGYNNGTGARTGDSGGGLLFLDNGQKLYYLRGVVSHQVESLTSIAAFTDIAQYLAWIKMVVQDVNDSELKDDTRLGFKSKK